MEKVFIMTVGSLLLTPIFFALCSDSILLVLCAVVYGFILWNSPKFSPKVRKFWRKFYRINLEWMQVR